MKKESGKGRYGIQIAYADGEINIQWYETKEQRDRVYVERTASKKRRISNGVKNHTISKKYRFIK